MRRFRWFVTAVAFLIVGIGSLAEGWNGTANVTMGWPPNAASVNFCGSAHGWTAIIGLLGLLLGVISLIVGIVSAATTSPAAERP